MFAVVRHIAYEEGYPGLYGMVYGETRNLSYANILPYYETVQGAVAAARLLNLNLEGLGDDLTSFYPVDAKGNRVWLPVPADDCGNDEMPF